MVHEYHGSSPDTDMVCELSQRIYGKPFGVFVLRIPDNRYCTGCPMSFIHGNNGYPFWSCLSEFYVENANQVKAKPIRGSRCLSFGNEILLPLDKDGRLKVLSYDDIEEMRVRSAIMTTTK